MGLLVEVVVVREVSVASDLTIDIPPLLMKFLLDAEELLPPGLAPDLDWVVTMTTPPSIFATRVAVRISMFQTVVSTTSLEPRAWERGGRRVRRLLPQVRDEPRGYDPQVGLSRVGPRGPRHVRVRVRVSIH